MEELNRQQTMPALALRGLTVFPQMLLHFDVGRQASIQALDESMASGQPIFLVAQRELAVESPQEKDLYSIGTICNVRQILRLPGDNVRVMVEGVSRGRLCLLPKTTPYLNALVEELPAEQPVRRSTRTEALIRQTYELFERFIELAPKMTPDVLLSVLSSEDPGYIADYIAQNLPMRTGDKQAILEELRPVRRLERLCQSLRREVEILELEQEMQGKVREQLTRSQRDYVLREQLKVLQQELGEEGAGGDSEIAEYRQRIAKAKLPQEVADKLTKEVGRLEKQPFGSAEATVLRNYLDTVLELPWGKHTKERVNVEAARRVLDVDHYGLEKVKERILEFLAVKQLAPGLKGQILCLEGPPGVGKTSLARSVATATGREYVRLSLGGVRDEAEIRGHRRTYVGAMPGKIIMALKRAKSSNPLFCLDEIDKMSSDYRGDPASALLEVLDPEQNKTFNDHYLDIDYDLSKVFFITTANSLHNIPAPLQDRMEIIELSSYLEVEKKHIARDFLLPRQIKEHGLKPGNISLPEETLTEVIRSYTREAGVRSLEREIGALCRKTAIKLVEEDNLDQCVTITPEDLETYLGVKKYRMDENEKSPKVGVVNGLAYTGVGGVLLNVETVIMPGKGNVATTGKIGEVMSESAKAALSYVRSRAAALGLKPDFHSEIDIHTHFPEGATPKDGPSAGTAITTSLVSALLGIPVRHDVAMTGEVTLRGRVLPIGGLREKLLAASRAEMATVIIPRDNAKDLKEVPDEILQTLRIELVDHVDEVLPIALDAPEDAIWDKSDCPSLIESLRRHHEPAVTTAQ